jgi:hypothetical protein
MSIDNPIDDLEKENKRLKKKLEKTESEYYSLLNRSGKLKLEGYNYRAEIKRLKEESKSLKVIEKENKVKRLEELLKEIEELKLNMNADEVIEANKKGIWKKIDDYPETNNEPFPLGLILWVGFILFMLYLLFAY